MSAVVMLIVVFFWPSTGKPPQVVSVVAPSVQVCQAAGRDVAAKIQADKEVRLATHYCLGVQTNAAAD